MSPLLTGTSREKFDDVIHQQTFRTLASLVEGDEDRFNKIRCLSPICGSTNRDLECRKHAVAEWYLNLIGAHGVSIMDTAPNWCSCDYMGCDCSIELPTSFPTSVFFGD